MTIQNMLQSIASLVEEREIIDHGTIRCIRSKDDIRAITECEGIDVGEVGTGTIGNNDLADRLRELAEEPGGIEFDDLARLNRVFLGESIEDYEDTENEDELRKLDRLISAAEDLLVS